LQIQQNIIKVLTNDPVQIIFDSGLQIKLNIFKSADGYRAMLMHKIDGKRRVNEFFTKSTKASEAKYQSYEIGSIAFYKVVKL